MWLKKIRDRWYSYHIMKLISKRNNLNKKIHDLIYKRFGWDEEEEKREELRIFTRDF